MNDHHRLNEFGLDLLTTFEKVPSDGSVPLTPGGAAMEPYICPGGWRTIGYGCTKWFGGRDVLPTDRLIDEAHARALLAEQLVEYEDAVKRLVTVPLNSHQFSALVCFAFNCGVAGLAGSTLLKHVNGNRFDNAADQFGAWLYSTRGAHKQALRGLLRRRYFEACLWMGYDGTLACADDAIGLVREKPPGNVGTDKVLSKTAFKDVLSVAQRFPLPVPQPPAVRLEPVQYVPAATADTPLDRQGIPIQLPIPREDELLLDQPAAPPKADAKGSPSVSEPPSPSSQAAVPSVSKSEPAKPSNRSQAPMSAPVEGPAAASVPPPVAPVPPPKPVIIGPQPINPNALPNNNDASKNMADSTRMLGMILVGIGSVVQVVSLRLGVGTAIGAVFFDLTRDPVVITLMVTAIVGALGWVTKRNGKKTFKKGADKAQGGLH